MIIHKRVPFLASITHFTLQTHFHEEKKHTHLHVQIAYEHIFDGEILPSFPLLFAHSAAPDCKSTKVSVCDKTKEIESLQTVWDCVSPSERRRAALVRQRHHEAKGAAGGQAGEAVQAYVHREPLMVKYRRLPMA